jgi:hypothetical protein
MKKSKIALKPYLDTLVDHCSRLSNDELKDIIIGLAKDVPTSGRVQFLEKVEAFLPGGKPAVRSRPEPMEQILEDIEALKESIEERVEAIEDGSYWDDPDDWDYDSYDEEPDHISDVQNEELGSFFEMAENLFLDDRLEDARKVYQALFGLLRYIDDYSYVSLGPENDVREARARYCRCVFETSDPKKRLNEFASAMEIDATDRYHGNTYDEDYPLLKDVIDSKTGEMTDLASFMRTWKTWLSKQGTEARAAMLLLEATNHLKGIEGVSKLARKWKSSQPRGYLFWLSLLKQENDLKNVIRVSKEGLKAIEDGGFRERIAEFIISAAEKLQDPKQLLLGKRERFISRANDRNLLDLVDEAKKQNARDKELDAVIKFFKAQKMDPERKILYVKALLMVGRLSEAAAMAKKEKSVGWSYHSHAGVVFGAVLSVLADHSEKAGAIQQILKWYANETSIFSERVSVDDGKGTSFYGEIVDGLKRNKGTRHQAESAFSWAEKIGKGRIDHIVSNKHRRAYERAAQVLGALADAYLAMGRKEVANRILNQYYNKKYNRHSAFRREVQNVVRSSDLLKNAGLPIK